MLRVFELDSCLVLRCLVSSCSLVLSCVDLTCVVLLGVALRSSQAAGERERRNGTSRSRSLKQGSVFSARCDQNEKYGLPPSMGTNLTKRGHEDVQLYISPVEMTNDIAPPPPRPARRPKVRRQQHALSCGRQLSRNKG